MARLIAVLAHLPAVRRAFLTVLFLAGLGDMVASIVLLAYQLTMTASPIVLTPIPPFSHVPLTTGLWRPLRLNADRLPACRPVDRHHLVPLHGVPDLVPLLEAVFNSPARIERILRPARRRRPGQGGEILEVNRGRTDRPRRDRGLGPDLGLELACRVSFWQWTWSASLCGVKPSRAERGCRDAAAQNSGPDQPLRRLADLPHASGCARSHVSSSSSHAQLGGSAVRDRLTNPLGIHPQLDVRLFLV